MKRLFLPAAFAAALLATTATSYSAGSGSGAAAPKVTPAVAKPLAGAQKLMQASPPDFKTALDLVHEAQAVPNRTPDDDYMINQFVASIAVGLKDYATATTAYEALADSPLLAQDDSKATILTNAVLLSTAKEHYQKAIHYGELLSAVGPLNNKVEANLAVAYFDTKDLPHAQTYAQKAIDDSKAAGEQPDPNAMSVLYNSRLKSNDTAAAEGMLEQMAAQSGSPDSWNRLITYTMDHSKPREIDAINLMRLAAVTNASMSAGDWSLLGSIALRKGYPGDALTAARHGGKAPGASAKAAADQRDLAREDAAGRSRNGEFNVQLAEDFYGYGRYADAEAAARRAISMGGAKDPSEPHMVLGMALVGQGRYADAVQSFEKVTAGSKTAHLWSVYAQSKTQPASASAH